MTPFFLDLKVELKDVICGIMTEEGKPNLVDYFPILKKIDLQGIRHRTFIYFGKLFKFFDDLIHERRKEDAVKQVMFWKCFSISSKKIPKRSIIIISNLCSSSRKFMNLSYIHRHYDSYIYHISCSSEL